MKFFKTDKSEIQFDGEPLGPVKKPTLALHYTTFDANELIKEDTKQVEIKFSLYIPMMGDTIHKRRDNFYRQIYYFKDFMEVVATLAERYISHKINP